MDNWDTLNSTEVDALREIGNIGAGNAATSLAQLLNRKISMSVPRAGLVPFAEIVHLVGNEEDLVACVDTRVSGPAPACVLFILQGQSAYYLVDMLLGRQSGETTQMGEMERSTLAEVGNILTGSFLAAFAQMTQIQFVPEVPALALDMLGAVLTTALVTSGYFSEQVLVIETTFFNEQDSINGHFFLVPQEGALKTILKAVGLSS